MRQASGRSSRNREENDEGLIFQPDARCHDTTAGGARCAPRAGVAGDARRRTGGARTVARLHRRRRDTCSRAQSRRTGTSPAGDSTCKDGRRELVMGPFTRLPAGWEHACALQTDGNARCWGDDGGGDGRLSPPVGPFTQLAVGGIQSCGVRTNDTIDCWGLGRWGGSRSPGLLHASHRGPPS